MIRNQPWFREIIAVGWPIAFYWIGVVLSLMVFSSCVFITQDTFNEKDIWALFWVWAATVSGVLVGQLASITRLRSTFFLVGTIFFFFLSVYGLMAYDDVIEAMFGEYVFIALLMFTLLGSIMASGGFWSLRVNRGLWAFWGPTMLAVSGILMVSEHFNYDEEWHAGNKHAIWSFGTLGILLMSVLLQLMFMAAREKHRVHRWMTAPVAAEPVAQRPDPIRPFAGLGTLVLMGMLLLAVTGASAVVAPYLWRTGPGGDDPGGHTIEEPAEPEEEKGGGGMPDMTGLQKVMQLVQQAVSMMCSLLTMVVLALAALAIFGLPVRRQMLLTHLRRPMWPVPPSRRAHLHWRLAEIAMGDAGVHRQPGETALEVAQRTVAQFPDVNLEALTTAAEISDRVAYGYTLDAQDADTIGRAAEMTYQAVWDTLTELQRIRNTYRWV